MTKLKDLSVEVAGEEAEDGGSVGVEMGVGVAELDGVTD